MAKPGPDSLLTKELTSKISELVYQGLTNADIQEQLGIKPSTWENWHARDCDGFRALLREARHRRLIKKAEERLEKNVDAVSENVSQRAAEFALERLDKENYSNKQQVDVTSGGLPILNLIGFEQVKEIGEDAESVDHQEITVSDITNE